MKGIEDVINSMDNYSKIHGFLSVKLMNKSRCDARIREASVPMVGEIIAVPVLCCPIDDGSLITVIPEKKIYDQWEKETSGVLNDAYLNMLVKNPPRIYQFDKLFSDSSYSGDDFLNNDIQIDTEGLGEVLTTVNKYHGASLVFCPGIAERISHLVDGGFYIAFTSIHEGIIHRDSIIDCDAVESALKNTNKTTRDKDFLTDKVIHYDINNGFSECESSHNIAID